MDLYWVICIFCTAITLFHMAKLPPLALISRRGLRWALVAILAALLLSVTWKFDSAFALLHAYAAMWYLACDVVYVLLHVVLQLRAKRADGETAPDTMRRTGRLIWGVLPWLLAISMMVGGVINARHVRVTAYTVKIAAAIEPMRIVLVTDTHMGSSLRAKDVEGLVAKVQAQQPDLILLGGDIIDERSQPEEVDAILSGCGALHAPLGVYYITGNHEYAANRKGTRQIGEWLDALRAVGITVLLDDCVTLENGYTLIGRNDPGGTTINGRKSLEQLVDEADKNGPLIVLDHRPLDIARGEYLGVAMQLSGDTHNGQVFPLTVLLRTLHYYEWIYGHKDTGNYHAITSSGAGTWRMPVRVGTRSEIVVVDIVQ